MSVFLTNSGDGCLGGLCAEASGHHKWIEAAPGFPWTGHIYNGGISDVIPGLQEYGIGQTQA